MIGPDLTVKEVEDTLRKFCKKSRRFGKATTGS
jgi:hypothetical protein